VSGRAALRPKEQAIDFDTFIERAWNDHATEPAAVAARLDAGRALVSDEAQLNRLMHLAHHLHGEHLGSCEQGLAFAEGLAQLPSFVAGGASGAALQRTRASLRLTGVIGVGAGDDDSAALSASDRIRVCAMAAANLAERDTARADRLLREALDLAQHAGLPATDPMHRALAVTGNQLACALEEKPLRSVDERALMILAAETARQHWAIAGTWLETERAEYRLAMTWLHAGEPLQARRHAQACLEIVEANQGAALERFFGWEALGRALRAAGDAGGHAQALARARQAFAALEDADKSWCGDSLEKLAADAASATS
jgi:hypothetical protein